MKGATIGFFLDLGGESANTLFSPYVWGPNGLGKVIDRVIGLKKYGLDLTLLLIKFHVAAEFRPDLIVEKPRLWNYSTKNRDIAASFPISLDEFKSFDECRRRRFLAKSVIMAIDMFQDRVGKRGLDIDFDALRRDVLNATNEYLRLWGVGPEA